MKSIICLALLLSLGSAALTISAQGICSCEQLLYSVDCNNMPGCSWNNNTCSLIQCSTYTLQNQCLQASKYCQWNVGLLNCSTFQGCRNIIITSQQNYKQCGQSNLQCLAYNGVECENILSPTFNLVCADFSNTCTENVGTDGVCIYNKQTSKCVPITSCVQATKESQCQLLNQTNGLSCQYINSACVQITGCNSFQSEASCKYYLPNFNSTSMILCQWNNNLQQCSEAKNSLYLNNTNCLVSTGYNYRWLPTASNPTNGICFTCKVNSKPQISIISRSSCQCSQFILYSDCNVEYCQWNTTTNLCIPIDCTIVTSQSICITLQGCYWNYQNTGGCVSFGQGQSCNSLPLTINNAICAAQNVYCPGFSGGVCQNANTLNKCSSATTQTGCQNIIGSDGICRWINEICLPLQSCTQILDANYCGSWQNQCQWNAELQLCQLITCSSFNKNPQKCLYVITGFQDSQYQLCRYNNNSSICENAYSAVGLTSENCVSNTASTYRWTNISTKKGMCVSCNQKLKNIQISDTCLCSQYYLESDCNNSGYCQYSSTGCVNTPCPNLFNQDICASTTYCYWNSQTGCQNFQGCNSLQASNYLECISQNTSCTSFTNGTCTTNPYQFNCQNISGQCYLVIQNSEGSSNGLCYKQGKNCYQITSCEQVPQYACPEKGIQESCYWNQQQKICQQISSCSYFQDQNSCKYYIAKPLTSQLIVCQWNSQTKQCNNLQNILTQLTSTTCQKNTFNKYRWVPTATGTQGYCVKCQYQQQIIETQIHTTCPCNYLLNQNDCLQSQQCNWNNNKCQNNICSNILSQDICISQQSCQWTNNACSNFNQNCAQFIGTNQLQCTSQQITCVGSNGQKCTNTLSKCESNVTMSGCVEQIGSNGYCFWNSQNSNCVSITECSQLPKNACISKTNACYYSSKSCQTITCQQLFSNTGKCNYITSLANPLKLQPCVLTNGVCQLATNVSQLNEEQCYANVGKTTRWIPFQIQGSSEVIGTCQLCSRSIVPTSGVGKCSCYQLLTQYDCQQGSNACVWSNDLNGCQPQTCNNITNQLICSSTDGCAWTLDNQKTFTCSQFVSCNSVTGTSLTLQNCLTYSVQCRGIYNNKCVSSPTSKCFSYSESQCVDIIGTDGPCVYNSNQNVCQAITSCSQITNQKLCQFQNHFCYWSLDDICSTIACNNILTQNDCTYVVTSYISGQLQLCQWDLQTSTCNNFYNQTSLTSYNCVIDTDYTYRWVPLSINQGVCAKCVINQQYMAGECMCSQIYTQWECKQNLNCQWNGTTCATLPCTSILSQYICSTNPNCMWQVPQNQCLKFTNCSDLQGSSNLECVIQSIYCQVQQIGKTQNTTRPCQASNTITTQCSSFNNSQINCLSNDLTCTWNAQSNQCTNNFSCANQTTALHCETFSIPGMVCIWNQQNGKCQQLTNCSQIQSYQVCMNVPRYCMWTQADQQSTPSCQPTQCSYFTQYNCNYYFTQFSLDTMSFCYWSTTLGTCLVATQLQTQLNYDNCYSNSKMSSRWSSTTKIGYCKSCMQTAISINPQLICACSQLTYSECIIASPLCTYNNGSCQQLSNCSAIQNNLLCTELSQCMWLNNACVPFTSCSAITAATTPLECLLFSKQCTVYNSTNSSCSEPLQCSSLTQTQCQQYNSQVEIGYCIWNNNLCQSVTSCTQITDISLCNLQKARCQWATSCVSFQCTSFKTLETCLFVYSSFNSGDITLCQWNSTSNTCLSVQTPATDTLGYNEIDCYVKTGHTYYYNGDACVACFEQVETLKILIVLLIFVWI